MQTGRDGLEMARPRPVCLPLTTRGRVGPIPYHLRNFVVCINSHPHRK